MPSLPLSALFYIYDATVILVYTVRTFQTYKTTKNEYSLLFVWVGLGISITFYLYGLPSLFLPSQSSLYGFLFLLGYFPLFLGTTFALLFALKTWGLRKLERVTLLSAPILITLFFFINLLSIPRVTITSGGLIQWGLTFPYDITFVVFLFFLNVVPGISLLLFQTSSKKAFFKKMLFGIAFIGGWITGSLIVIFDEHTSILFASFVSQFIAFSIIGSIVLIDMLMHEEGQASYIQWEPREFEPLEVKKANA